MNDRIWPTLTPFFSFSFRYNLWYFAKLLCERFRYIIWRKQVLDKMEKEKEFTDWTIEMRRKVNEGIARCLKKVGFLKK